MRNPRQDLYTCSFTLHGVIDSLLNIVSNMQDTDYKVDSLSCVFLLHTNVARLLYSVLCCTVVAYNHTWNVGLPWSVTG